MEVHVSSVYVHSAICAFYFIDMWGYTQYMWCNLFGVMVFHRSIVNWSGGVDVSSVYVHSVICVSYLV